MADGQQRLAEPTGVDLTRAPVAWTGKHALSSFSPMAMELVPDRRPHLLIEAECKVRIAARLAEATFDFLGRDGETSDQYRTLGSRVHRISGERCLHWSFGGASPVIGTPGNGSGVGQTKFCGHGFGDGPLWRTSIAAADAELTYSSNAGTETSDVMRTRDESMSDAILSRDAVPAVRTG